MSLIGRMERKIKRYIYRKKVMKESGSCGENLKVNFATKVTCNTYLGSNCNFNGCTITGKGKVTIGDNFHSGRNVQMITSFHNYDGGTEIPYDSTYIDKDIHIGKQVWLGNNVIVLGGVNIADGAVIQAGSVVVSDIPYCSVAGGSPAKVFKTRDIKHYEDLKAMGKFH
ncbi:MAG: acyltransferase [Clostridiales bacterium]|nr:acyltransferase [Clostridiales bacterium]